MSEQNQKSFKTTTAPRVTDSPIGMPHGETGADKASLSRSTGPTENPVQAWAMRRDPWEADQVFRLQLSSLPTVQLVTTRTPAPDRRLVVQRLEAPREVLEQSAAKHAQLMAPAPDNTVQEWIAELDAITHHRATDALTANVRLRALTGRLRGYPADLVRHVLLVKRWKFFPSWAELGDELDRLAYDRQAMDRALRAALDRPEGAPPQIERKVIDFERACEIRAEVLGR